MLIHIATHVVIKILLSSLKQQKNGPALEIRCMSYTAWVCMSLTNKTSAVSQYTYNNSYKHTSINEFSAHELVTEMNSEEKKTLLV